MFRSKISLVLLVLAGFLGGSAGGYCPLGDLDGNCTVEWEDLRLFAQQWLDAGACSEPNCANLDKLNGVNGVDFALLAGNWLKECPLVINEFMAINDSNLIDGDGNYSDWIEIYNAGVQQVSLSGLYLTDKEDNLTRWQFPDVNIGANGYMAVFASRKEQADYPGNYPYLDPNGYYHTNFKLDGDGEYVAIVAPDGSSIVDNIDFGRQYNDISYGRFPDANDDWRLMGLATPGAQNNGGYLGAVADTKFSHDRGFYDTSFSVTITTATDGATIHYTLDGNEPNESHGTVYSGPVAITTTTCLRAMAFKAGWMPTNVDTQTYIFLDDVKTQSDSDAYARGFPSTWETKDGGVYSADYEVDPDIVGDQAYSGMFKDAMKAIPTMSLVTDMKHWFDPQTGIYANPLMYYDPESGLDWERPVSVEFFDPCTGADFQVNAGIRIAGNQSRDSSLNPKHGLRIFFKSKFGPSMLEFPFYENTDVERFNNISLRPQFHWNWLNEGSELRGQYLRDTFAQDTFRDMGYLSPDSTFVHLYLNGVYWGMYQASERPDDSFLAGHLGGQREDYDVIEGILIGWDPHVSSVEYKAGEPNGWDNMWSMFDSYDYNIPMNTPDYQQLQEHLDVTQFVDYIIYNSFVVNWDWCAKNWYAGSRRNPSNADGPPAGKWVFYPWDSEISMLQYSFSHEFPFSGYYGWGPGIMHNALHNNPDYNRLFGDRVHKLLFNGGVLTEQKNIDRYEKRANQIEDAVVGESARWGDYLNPSSPYTRDDHWANERDRMVNPAHGCEPGDLCPYFPLRTSAAIGQYRSYGLYPNVDAPVFYINAGYQHGGVVNAGDILTMTAASGTIYYTLDGSDPTEPGALVYGNVYNDITLVLEDASKKVLVPTSNIGTTWKGGNEPYSDSGWNSGTFVPGKTGGVGYDRNPDYAPYISYDVRTEMDGIMGSCYVRIPFTVNANDLADFTSLTLKLRYDDGFVTYINGVEVASDMDPSPLEWDSEGDGLHGDMVPMIFENFDISGNISDLQAGTNILAIQGLNSPKSSSDFLISAELEARIQVSQSQIPIDKSTIVKARALDGTWSALNEANYALPEVAEGLRITEIMYHPADSGDPNDPNEEFIELKNIGPNTINLNLVSFTEGIHFTFPILDLAAGEYVLVVKDQAAFTSQYPGFTGVIAGQYIGSLGNGGERIRLEDAIGQTIHDFRYRDDWRWNTDGDGYSLTIIEPTNGDPNSWNEKNGWRPSAFVGGSPGWDDTADTHNPGAIVINELLAHSDSYPSDWIELHNTTDGAIDISGWFISDNDSNLMKYQIPGSTVIPDGGYIVFTQDDDFGGEFGFSEDGETAYLSSGLDANGNLSGYREKEDFGASESGVAFGRYWKSTGTFNFVAMSINSPGASFEGAPNAYPKVGPVVINEIMYNPEFGGQNEEYIELYNTGGSPVTLQEYDSEESVYVPWKFTDGIDFTFPTGPAVTINAGDYLLVVKDLAAFALVYPGVPAGKVVGPYLGQLSDDGEKLEISKPGDADDITGERYYIRVDRVNYSDGSHPEDCPGGIDLWPTQPDGGGKSLSRIDSSLYGNDPNNWHADVPSPGVVNP